ncbi:MAG: hypothetical protein KDC24_12595 [Saprospiraceae bacterium]|nr:hypothetical protein [Saprospiraceae bacterium]
MGKDFYIGWKDEAPESNKKNIKRLLITLMVIISVIAMVLVVFSKSFTTHTFEFGQEKTFSGVLYVHPFPVLKLDKGQSPYKGNDYALLVGYGKFGASTYLQGAKIPKGDLSGKRVTISGTLIYGDGKVLIELTEKEKSLLEIENTVPPSAFSEKNRATMNGEIIDPKCWFGVMKPAEGKVHKSCAIRCISGGIPPVFRMGDSGSSYNYYVLLDETGNLLREEILPYVGESIKVQGSLSEINGWPVLEIDPDLIKYQ